MKSLLTSLTVRGSAAMLAAGLLLVPGLGSRANDGATANLLSDAERAAGWQLLFDGHTTTGWRGFKQDKFPSTGWVVEQGCLHHTAKGGGGDIITRDRFDDYELTFEWRINANGNGGLKYFITEDRTEAIGHEYQLLGEPDLAAVLKDPRHATASFYAVLPVSTNFPFASPEAWKTSRIVVKGGHVEHWLEGRQVLAYELGSEPVKAGIAASKFRNVAGFGTKFTHHLLLQDHGGDVWFRNLKLRPLKP